MKRGIEETEEGKERKNARWHHIVSESDDDVKKMQQDYNNRNDGTPGASSSSNPPPTGEKRLLERTSGEDEAPDKAQGISSICIGYGASDKKGDVNIKDYEEALRKERWRKNIRRKTRQDSVSCTFEGSTLATGI